MPELLLLLSSWRHGQMASYHQTMIKLGRYMTRILYYTGDMLGDLAMDVR